MTDQTLLVAIKKTLIDSVDSVTNGVDLLISVATESEVLEKVPLVSIGVKLLKAKDSFRQHLFVRNCYALIQACKAANRERREKLWQRLSENPNRAEDFSDTLFLVATDSSKPMKAAVVGRLIAALCNEQIDYEQYDTLVHIVHGASIAALSALPQFFNRTGGRPVSRAHTIAEEPLLFSCGVGSRHGNLFRISDLGQALYRIGFGGIIAT